MKARVACAGAVAFATLAFARESRADDTAEAVAAVAAGGALGVANITFTAYTGARVSAHEEPTQEWMVAQSVITGLETLFVSGGAAAIAHEDKKEEALALLALPVGIWVGGLATFSTWSLAAPGEDDVTLNERLGLSFVAGTNLAFMSSAVGSLVAGRFSPYYIAIPEATLMLPECVLTAIKAGLDENGRGGWAALSVWSGVLAVHGIASVIGKATKADTSSPTVEPPPPALPTPQPGTVDPYYIDPAVPPSPPAPPATPPPAVVPAPVPGTSTIAPGLSLFGVF